MQFIKIVAFVLSTLLFQYVHGQEIEFEQDILTSSNLHFGRLGNFEGSIFGLDILSGKNDLRFAIENVGEGIFMNNLLRVRVGKGVDPVEGTLHVQDSLEFLIIADGDHVNGSRMRVQNGSTGGTSWDLLSTGVNNTEGAGHLVFDQFGVAPRMIIRNDGNVGIGEISPNDALDVLGDIDATGCIQTDDTGSIGGTCLSDRRFKRNILTLQNQLDKIMALNPVSFDWKNPSINGNQSEDIGLIAQEVEEVFPEMVKTGEDGVKKVRYDISLQMRVIKALQEQQVIIEDQQSQINQQKSELRNIREEMMVLKELLLER